MFGYVTVNREELSEADKARYSAFYCGLCRTLREDWGLVGRMTLTYDMTFLTVLLTALYEPELESGKGRCLAHPTQKRPYCVSGVTRYAAAMNYALTWHKLADDWEDDKNLLARSGVRIMRANYQRVEAAYPRQCAAMRSCVERLAALEREKCAVVDQPAARFGELLGELFVMKEDVWSDTLRDMGRALGGFIYIMDAYDDLERDVRKQRYNPLAGLRDAPELDAGCREMLTVLMARCTEAFEALPIVEDAALIRNILYSGVWAGYERIRRRKRRDGKGDNQ